MHALCPASAGDSVSARDDILGRVRSALGEHPAYDPTGSAGVPAESSAMVAPGAGDAALLELFVERVADYRAVVVRCGRDEVAEVVREALGDSASVIVPEGFPTSSLLSRRVPRWSSTSR